MSLPYFRELYTMTRTIYQTTRRSIRDNGLRYTTQYAIDTSDTDTLLTCDDIANTIRETDWLAMRLQFAKLIAPAVAIQLTTTVKI